MALRTLTEATSLAALVAVGMLFPPAAHADKIKNCGTEIVPVTAPVTNPPNANAGFTQTTTTTTTTTQIASCNSASDTGRHVDTKTDVGPVTNKGGGTPGGF